MSLTSLSPSPRKVYLWHMFFALLVRNGPLPAELKLRENTGNHKLLKPFLVAAETVTMSLQNLL